jgi:hypothetical protein
MTVWAHSPKKRDNQGDLTGLVFAQPRPLGQGFTGWVTPKTPGWHLDSGRVGDLISEFIAATFFILCNSINQINQI